MKKILSLILALLLCFSISSYASDKAEEKTVSPDMDFAVAMGIFDDDVSPNEPITRIELAEVFYNILLPEVEPAVYKSKYFADVDYEESPYADFVYQSGLMNGVGNGKFNPDGNLTYAQLIKVVVSFLGYRATAEAKGGYPYGYISVANETGISYSGIADNNSLITNAGVASVMRLATNVPLMKRASYGTEDEEYFTDKNSDWLSEYMKISRVRGVVSGTSLTSLNGESLDVDEITIGTDIFSVTDATQNLINLIGYEVDVYCRDYTANRTNQAVYYEETDSNNVLKIDGDDVTGYYSSALLHGDNEKARLSSVLKLIFNGTYLSSYDAEDFTPFRGTDLEGSITLIDNNSDRAYDYAIVDAYKSYVVSDIVDNVMFNKFYPEEIIDLGKNFKDGDIEITNILSQPLLLGKISKGDIINVSRDKSGDVKRIVVTIDTFTGVFQEINADMREMTVGGITFKMSENFLNNPLSDYADIGLGTEVTLYFNKDGKISDIEGIKPKANLAYLVQVYKGSGMDKECKINVFTPDNSFKELTLAQKLKLRDSTVSVKDADAIDTFPKDTNGSVRQPIQYTLNSDGKVNWIDYSTDTTPRDGLYMIEGFDGRTQSLYYRAGQYNFESKLFLSSSTVIFNVSKDSDPTNRENYYIEAPSYYGGDGQRTVDFVAYGLTKEESPCAAILVEKDGVKTVSTDGNLLIVDEISIAVKNDEEVYKIKGFTYSNGVSTFYADKQALDSVFGSDLPQKGDIIQTRSFEGLIKYAKDIFDFDTKTFKTGINPSTSSFESACRCIYGDVIYNDGSYIKVKIDGTENIMAFNLSGVKVVEIDYSVSQKGEMSSANVSDIYDTKHYGDYASKVVVRTRNGDTRTVVVYNGLGGAR